MADQRAQTGTGEAANELAGKEEGEGVLPPEPSPA